MHCGNALHPGMHIQAVFCVDRLFTTFEKDVTDGLYNTEMERHETVDSGIIRVDMAWKNHQDCHPVKIWHFDTGISGIQSSIRWVDVELVQRLNHHRRDPVSRAEFLHNLAFESTESDLICFLLPA